MYEVVFYMDKYGWKSTSIAEGDLRDHREWAILAAKRFGAKYVHIRRMDDDGIYLNGITPESRLDIDWKEETNYETIKETKDGKVKATKGED